VSYDEERDCKVCDSGHRVDCISNTDGPWGYVVHELLEKERHPIRVPLEKDIEARSFDYKGHKYILFEKTNVAPCQFKKATRFCPLRQLCRIYNALSQQLREDFA